jgi:ribosome assembly protein 1
LLLSQEKNSSSEEGSKGTDDWVLEEKDDSNLYFSPETGNVIFASAMDGWAFRVHEFSSIYSKKLGIKHSLLRKVLWGEYYLDPKSKRIVGPKGLKGRNLKPVFVQFVLENIWSIYSAVFETRYFEIFALIPVIVQS